MSGGVTCRPCDSTADDAFVFAFLVGFDFLSLVLTLLFSSDVSLSARIKALPWGHNTIGLELGDTPESFVALNVAKSAPTTLVITASSHLNDLNARQASFEEDFRQPSFEDFSITTSDDFLWTSSEFFWMISSNDFDLCLPFLNEC